VHGTVAAPCHVSLRKTHITLKRSYCSINSSAANQTVSMFQNDRDLRTDAVLRPNDRCGQQLDDHHDEQNSLHTAQIYATCKDGLPEQ